MIAASAVLLPAPEDPVSTTPRWMSVCRVSPATAGAAAPGQRTGSSWVASRVSSGTGCGAMGSVVGVGVRSSSARRVALCRASGSPATSSAVASGGEGEDGELGSGQPAGAQRGDAEDEAGQRGGADGQRAHGRAGAAGECGAAPGLGERGVHGVQRGAAAAGGLEGLSGRHQGQCGREQAGGDESDEDGQAGRGEQQADPDRGAGGDVHRRGRRDEARAPARPADCPHRTQVG
jgi:hypothetical protein